VSVGKRLVFEFATYLVAGDKPLSLTLVAIWQLRPGLASGRGDTVRATAAELPAFSSAAPYPAERLRLDLAA
jgi:hypothetical protein